MTPASRLLFLLPLFIGCVACNSAEEGGDDTSTPPPDPADDDGSDRNGGVVHTGDGGDTEVLDMLLSSREDCEEVVIKIWIGDGPCPPDPNTAPTYDSAGLVALPWRPGVPVKVSPKVAQDGKFTVYTLVVVPQGDGCFCVYESCEELRVPRRGQSHPFRIDLQRVEGLPDLRLLGAERAPMSAGSGPEKTIIILREGR